MCSVSGCDQEKTVGGKCKFHYNEYMREYVAKRYKRLRSEWIERLGGSCAACGSRDNLEFDHIDASQKKYNIGKILSTHSKQKVEEEMARCQLLCKECHLEKTIREEDIYIVDHGEGLTGKKSCYCSLCGPLKSAYNKRYKPEPKRSRSKNPLRHGERAMYTGKHKCRCDLCKQAQRDYMREYSLNKKA